jgi:hypothetical protein
MILTKGMVVSESRLFLSRVGGDYLDTRTLSPYAF